MDDTAATNHDASRHVATPYDPLRHTLSVREVEMQLSAAGVPRTARTIQRLCENGVFNASPLGPNNQWLIAPDSVPKVIGDLRALDEQRARRVAMQRDMTRHDGQAVEPNSVGDIVRHDATLRDVSRQEINTLEETPTQAPSDTVRHDATGRDTSSEARDEIAQSTRHVATDLDIFSHPYVLKLEDRLEKLEEKYEAQVRRTEEIQIQSQEKVLELQRMTTIGQSKQLAEFLLQAKEWLIPGSKPSERGLLDGAPPSTYPHGSSSEIGERDV